MVFGITALGLAKLAPFIGSTIAGLFGKKKLAAGLGIAGGALGGLTKGPGGKLSFNLGGVLQGDPRQV